MSLNAPDFQAYQRSVAALWASSPLRWRVDNLEHEAAAKLAEEAGEAIKEINALAPPTGPMEPWAAAWKRLEAELGDVLFVVARVANIYSIDLGQAAQISLDKFVARYAGPDLPGLTPPRNCDVCGQPVERRPTNRRAETPWEEMTFLPGPSKPAITGHQVCVRAVMQRMEAAGRRPGDPYPPCPGESAECYFMEDRAAVAGSRCAQCGHVKEGAR